MDRERRWTKRLWRGLAMASLPLALLLFAQWQPDYQPPIFDAQVHYNREAWPRVRVAAIANGIAELNVPWLLVGSTPNEGTWRLAAALPGRVIPMWVPELPAASRDRWVDDPAQLLAMVEALRLRPYRGIGELWLASGDLHREGVRLLLRLAREHGLVLHLRTDRVAIEGLFALDPAVRVLWAHAGVYSSATEVDTLLRRHPNLWVELSHRNDATPQGRLAPAWRQLILDHPSRVLVGSGTYNPDYWYQYRTIIGNHRQWLASLPEETAARVAYRNGEALFRLSPGPASGAPRPPG